MQKQKKSEQRKKNNLRGWKKLSLTLLKGHLVFAFAPSVMNQTRLETKSGLLIEQITELALESRSCQAGNFHSIFGWHYAIKRGNFLRLKSLKKIGRCGELKGFKKKKKDGSQRLRKSVFVVSLKAPIWRFDCNSAWGWPNNDPLDGHQYLRLVYPRFAPKARPLNGHRYDRPIQVFGWLFHLSIWSRDPATMEGDFHFLSGPHNRVVNKWKSRTTIRTKVTWLCKKKKQNVVHLWYIFQRKFSVTDSKAHLFECSILGLSLKAVCCDGSRMG